MQVSESSTAKRNKKKKSALKKGEAFKDVNLDDLNDFCNDFMDAPVAEKPVQEDE